MHCWQSEVLSEDLPLPLMALTLGSCLDSRPCLGLEILSLVRSLGRPVLPATLRSHAIRIGLGT